MQFKAIETATRFQSMHPAGDAMTESKTYSISYIISIHAPAKGTTFRAGWLNNSNNFSIHASMRSATFIRHKRVFLDKFQSMYLQKGFDLAVTLIKMSFCYFNPRTHGGCDNGFKTHSRQNPHFNPRTHGGCDRNRHLLQRRQLHFNPRTHGGCDVIFNCFCSYHRYFNPRTHGGCDLCINIFICGKKHFNPRTHGGCDILVYIRVW